MHIIKITPNLLFEYQCTSGKFITLPNRIETFFARIGMLYRPALRYIKRLTGSRHSRVRSHCMPACRAHRSPTINFIHTRTHADTGRQTAGHMEGQTGGTTNKDNSPSHRISDHPDLTSDVSKAASVKAKTTATCCRSTASARQHTTLFLQSSQASSAMVNGH